MKFSLSEQLCGWGIKFPEERYVRSEVQSPERTLKTGDSVILTFMFELTLQTRSLRQNAEYIV